MRKFAAVVLLIVLCLAPLSEGYAISGMPYKDFLQSYSDNVQFINQCENRFMLPLVFSSATSGHGDGRMLYQIFGDVLSITIRTDPTDTYIEFCEIKLTAPEGMEVGSSVYNDFAISAYQCYALQMAMDNRATPYDRFALVSDTNAALKLNPVYSIQLGVYAMNCISENGTVTISFVNATADPTPSPEPEETPAPTEEAGGQDDGGDIPPEDNDEGAGMG